MKHPKFLLLNLERKHAHWIARKYLLPTVERGKSTLLNQKIEVELLGTNVYCKNNKSDEIITTELKEFFCEGRRSLWAYTDVWNQVCKMFNSKSTFQDIVEIFDINNNAYSYESFVKNYKILIKNKL